ncbi:MAG: ImmA/IrrE family metallo-endopeptidase [Planctomycetota bacterium]
MIDYPAAFPDRVLVGNRTFEIRPMTPLECNAVGDGVCDLVNDVIAINTSQSDANIRETLWHEIAHAVHHVAKLTDGCSEEDFANRAAPIWIDVVTRNVDFRVFVSTDCNKNRDN